MGYLNMDIREGSFDDIGASGSIDGMCEDHVPSWEYRDRSVEILKELERRAIEEEWDYEG